jgi:hypothetical protein
VKSFTEFNRHQDGRFGLGSECKNLSEWERRNTFDGFFAKLLISARSNANHRLRNGRIEAGVCDITKEDLINIWNKQNGRCYYSGIQMTPQPSSNWQCSLERFDDDKGYTIDNIVLVCLEFNNSAKWTLEKIKRTIFLVHEYHDNILLLQEIDNNLNTIKPQSKHKPNVTNDKGEFKCKKCDIFKSQEDFIKDLSKGCKDCRVKYKKDYKSTINGHLYTLLDNCKHHAVESNKSSRSENITFEITQKDLVDLLRNQYGRCAYSGIKLNHGVSREKDWVASLERINPLGGYTRDNICLICREFNGTDYTSILKYSNGGSGAWSREKFNFFLSTMLTNILPNLSMNIDGVNFSLDMWKTINNPSYLVRSLTPSFQLEIVNSDQS